MHVLTCVGEVLERCEVCRACAKAPHVPVAGASTASMIKGKSQVDLPSLDDVVALHAMGVFPEYPLLVPGRSKNPQEDRGAFFSS